MQHGQSGGGTPPPEAEAWPADFALRQERGASELVMSSGVERDGPLSARLLSLSECWDDFFLALSSPGRFIEAEGGGGATAEGRSSCVFEWYELTCAELWPYIGSLLSPGACLCLCLCLCLYLCLCRCRCR